MRKVLLFTLEYPPDTGGIATYLGTLHDGLTDCTVLRPQFWRWWPRWLPAVWQGAQIIQEKKIQVVTVSHVLPMGIVAFFCRLITGVPYIIFFHGLDLLRASKNPWKRMLVRIVVRFSETVVANSEYTARLLRDSISPRSLEVITPCISVLPKEDFELAKTGLVLLSVARLVPRKNHALVIEALDELREEFPTVRYVVIGEGPYRANLEELVRIKNLTERVDFLGNVSDSVREEWYRKADIFVLPTWSRGDDVEGFGIVFLEAASYGMPVVSGRGGGVDEVVENGVTGISVDPASKEELVAAIRQLLRDAELRKQLGEAGRSQVKSKFLCDDRKRMIQELYGRKQ
ncbi:MAG: glycosyltransferase family 4 protein [bacterium]|nr:glycosyltransferase family 4 protein [bacterium]